MLPRLIRWLALKILSVLKSQFQLLLMQHSKFFLPNEESTIAHDHSLFDDPPNPSSREGKVQKYKRLYIRYYDR